MLYLRHLGLAVIAVAVWMSRVLAFGHQGAFFSKKIKLIKI
jgi:hypothetical protein